MQKKIILIRCIIFIILSIVLVAMGMNADKVFNRNTNDESYTYSPYNLYTGEANIECLYYNIEDFIAIKEFEIEDFDEDIGTIRGIIVPHHLLAKDLIHEAFQAVNHSRNVHDNIEYKTVVVFGPDHESIERGKVFTSTSDWQSPKGVLNAEKDAINKLMDLDFLVENDSKITIEHSISSLVPFIKYYFSDAKIIPLALTKQLSYENLNNLVTLLIKNVDIASTLFISSVDFSHYLSLDEANSMDAVSIEAISNKEIETIMTFTNDNLDSANSIVALLKTMDLIGIEKSRMLNKGNSQIILEKNIKETTSYITFLFY